MLSISHSVSYGAVVFKWLCGGRRIRWPCGTAFYRANGVYAVSVTGVFVVIDCSLATFVARVLGFKASMFLDPALASFHFLVLLVLLDCFCL